MVDRKIMTASHRHTDRAYLGIVSCPAIPRTGSCSSEDCYMFYSNSCLCYARSAMCNLSFRPSLMSCQCLFWYLHWKKENLICVAFRQTKNIKRGNGFSEMQYIFYDCLYWSGYWACNTKLLVWFTVWVLLTSPELLSKISSCGNGLYVKNIIQVGLDKSIN